MTERQILEQYLNKPAGRKLLKTIRFAEGTSGPKGYQTMFGGGTFQDMSRHPNKVISSGGYKSAAAGAYQFLPGTWQAQASRLGLKGFGPEEQDIAALGLARNRLKSIGGLATLEKEGLSPRVAAALSPEWASFPTEKGVSYYGQPVKPLSKLQEVYAQQVTPAASPAPVSATPKRMQKANSLLDAAMLSVIKDAIRNATNVPTVPSAFGAGGFRPLTTLF